MSDSAMLTKVLKSAVKKGASDVHAKAGDVFRARVDGELVALTKQRLTPDQTRSLAATFADLAFDDPRLDTLRDFDCSWGEPGVGRFRVNVLRQRSSFMIVLRVIPFSVPTPESLELPDIISGFAELANGLVLITGPGGSGKTSTMAAMIHHSNRSTARHVITLEDPIEFLHRDLTGSITQREVGTDTEDTATGIQTALRQDPDVLVIGELRDPVAMDLAIRAAESGYLVLAEMAAVDIVSALIQASATLPPDEREVGRMRLAAVLAGAAAQRLIHREDGEGRRVIVEWLDPTDAIREAVSSGADAAALRRAFEKAVKDGHGEAFPKH
jgi:twitching motility protein PilT